MRISDILRDGRVHFSCEVFPPKAFADMEQAARGDPGNRCPGAGLHFRDLWRGRKNPSPYPGAGPGGGTVRPDVPVPPDLPDSTRAQVEDVLTRMQAAGLENVLALRGDPPKDGPAAGDFPYAAALIRLIKARGNFCVGAAC